MQEATLCLSLVGIEIILVLIKYSMPSSSLSSVKLVMSPAPAESAGKARYASHDPSFIGCPMYEFSYIHFHVPYNLDSNLYQECVFSSSNGINIVSELKSMPLRFVLRSAMFVQGMLLVKGDENERVKFIRKDYSSELRLSGGSDPWEGRLEFLVNNTWMPMCLPYRRSFTVEGKIVCQQLNLYYQR